MLPLRSTLSIAALLTSLPTGLLAAVDFNHQIVPLLRKHCAECHSGEKQKGGLSINDHASFLKGGENGPIIDLKSPEKSRLLEVVSTKDEDLRMPPKGPGLTPAEVALLKQWLAEGAPWEPGFAFTKPTYEPPLKPREVALPPASSGRQHPVDRILDGYFANQKITPTAVLDDGAFLRRAHLDLIGLLPTAEELQAFLSDSSPDKRVKLIDSLLARDVDYTEHWLTFWNDLLRNDYGGTGFITGGRKQVSKWLYEALVSNKPFDQMARELIAPSGDESRGFIDGIKWRGEVSAGQTVEIQFAQSMGQSFLGINLKCASCHDSFVDRWKLDEAYGLAAIYAEKPLEVHRCDKPVGRKATAAWLFPEIGQVDAAAPRDARLQQLASLLTHPQNGRVPRTFVNRLWHRLMGHGIVHPLDSMQSEPWSADLLDYLAWEFQRGGFNIKHVLRLIATSDAYQRRAESVEQAEGTYVFKGPRARRLTAEQWVDAVWQITGAGPAKFDAPVFRGKPDPEAARTMPLTGKWIWGDTAAPGKVPAAGEKVLLRTTWKLSAAPAAGAAIVTCDNGFSLFINGKLISKSDDWTHVTAVSLHDKLNAGDNAIVIRADNAGKGPNPAGLYFQAQVKLPDGNVSSLSSDSKWQASYKVPEGKEGRLGALPKDWQAATEVNPVGSWSSALKQQGPALLSQGVTAGTRVVRASLLKSDFLQRSLGRPNRDQIVSARPNELTTLEALDLANGAALTQALEKGGAALAGRAWKDSSQLADWIYQSTLCRNPTATERSAVLELLGEKPTATAISDLLWAVLMQPEFVYVR